MHLQLIDIHKYYGSIHANRGISLSVRPGSIHGILGENGAGKSTLMKILAGYLRKSSGRILLDGAPVDISSPAVATRLGIGMLYQDPMDFPPMTVLENFLIGQPARPRRTVTEWMSIFRDLCGRFDFRLDPDTSLEILTVGERQQVELLRLLSLGVRLLILDEPTTGISPVQKSVLFQGLRKIADEGKTVLIISHKIEDMEALCDRVTVLKQGAVAGECEAPFDPEEVLSLMFGDPPTPPPKCARTPGRVLLQFEKVAAAGGRTGLTDCTVSVRQGEVVGLAGLEGSGQGVFLRLAAGLERPLAGKIVLEDHPMIEANHHAFKKRGVSFLPAARLEEGLVPGLTLTEHCALAACPPSFLVPWEEARRVARHKVETFRIRGRPDTPAEGLSGGNQQRLLLSLIPERPKLLLMEHPTRGLDVESAHWVWQHLLRLCDQGTSIVFSSPELDEILMVADRVLVFFNGRIVLDARGPEMDAERIGRAIAGKL